MNRHLARNAGWDLRCCSCGLVKFHSTGKYNPRRHIRRTPPGTLGHDEDCALLVSLIVEYPRIAIILHGSSRPFSIQCCLSLVICIHENIWRCRKIRLAGFDTEPIGDNRLLPSLTGQGSGDWRAVLLGNTAHLNGGLLTISRVASDLDHISGLIGLLRSAIDGVIGILRLICLQRHIHRICLVGCRSFELRADARLHDTGTLQQDHAIRVTGCRDSATAHLIFLSGIKIGDRLPILKDASHINTVCARLARKRTHYLILIIVLQMIGSAEGIDIAAKHLMLAAAHREVLIPELSHLLPVCQHILVIIGKVHIRTESLIQIITSGKEILPANLPVHLIAIINLHAARRKQKAGSDILALLGRGFKYSHACTVIMGRNIT